MTLAQTTENIKTRLENLTESVEDEDVLIFGLLLHGEYDNPMGAEVVGTIQAESEGDELDFGGGTNIPPSPFNVPIFVSIHVTGTKNVAMPRLYEIVRMVKAEFRKDMTFNDTCTASFGKPKSVLYASLLNASSGEHLAVTGTIIINAYFTE